MGDKQQARLALNGLALFVAGLAIAIPFAIVFARGDDDHTHLWSVAHLEALVHGLLLMGLGAIGSRIALTPRHATIAVTLMVTGAWSSIAGATVGATWDVLGLEPGHGAANTVAWALLGYGTVSVTVSLVWMLWGAVRSSRSTEAGDQRVELLPQFGPGPRHAAVLDVARWENWGRTQTAHPARVVTPTSLIELGDEVRTARAQGLRVKAVGGGYSWSAGAVTDGVLIDMSALDRPIGSTPATADRPATMTVEAGTTIHNMTKQAGELGLTLATTTVIPWVQLGGVLANGCHGSGRDVSIVADQVCAMDVVGADGRVTRYERDDSDTWRALLVNLGALGIVYSVTVECEPTYDVRATDTVVSMRDAVDDLERLFADNEAMELFWFPFNEHALVKVWNRTDESRTEHLPGRAWDDLVQAFDQALSHPLRTALEIDPSLTPKLCRMMFALMEKHDVVCPAPWAMQYATSFAPVIDTSYAIPIDAGFASVKAAWNAGVDLVEAWAAGGRYPQNMVLHARFVGRPSVALLSPTEGHQRGSCLIEALTFEGTNWREDYFGELGERWQALGGRPHWAKLVYAPTDYQAMYGENLNRFRAIRERLDPDGLFLNDFVESILGAR